MLIGRESELQYLDNYYQREGSQLLVVYGQKYIGKTTLLKEFMKEKESHYYLARPGSEREHLIQWGNQLSIKGHKWEHFPGFYDIFAAIGKESQEKKVIVIDEFQNIVKGSETFMKELIRFLHSEEMSEDVIVILCSSSIGWIENSMITKIGEAAYELSGFLKIKELLFEDIVQRFPNFRIEECVEAYAVLGGIPGLWNQFDDTLTIQQNICRNILNPDSLLFEEGERLVTEQLRETSVYNTILAAIASGKHKLNDLYLYTDYSRAKISVYLKNLMELELVEKVFSYDTAGKENVQKGIYRIIHPLVHFYFSYMYPHMSDLQTLSVGEFYNEYIYPSFRTFVSDCFRKVCRQHLAKWNEKGKLPIYYENSGEWVGKVGTIDVIAQDENGKTLVALCNWERPMMTYYDYEWLISCAAKAKIKADYIYMYTATGFDEKLNLEARVKSNLKLIQISDI